MVSFEAAINTSLCNINDGISKMCNLLQNEEDRTVDVYYITLPEDGTTRTFAVGETKINFLTGTITNPDGSLEYITRKLNDVQDKEVLHSLSLYSSQEIKFRLDSSGLSPIKANFLFQLPFVTYTTMYIICEVQSSINLFACTNPRATLGTFRVTDVTTITQDNVTGDATEAQTWDAISTLENNLNRIRHHIIAITGETWGTVSNTIVSLFDTTTGHDHDGTDSKKVDHDNLLNKGSNAHSVLDSHLTAVNNPHTVTKAQVGLTNVDDIQQLPLSQKGAVNGVAELDASGDIPLAQIPNTLTGKDADTLDTKHYSDIASEIDGDITTHGALTTAVHGVGASSVASQANIDTHAALTASHGVAEVADKATVSAEIDGDITTHGADTTTHGATGAVVGTTNTQTLTNKTIELDDALGSDHTYEGLTTDDTVGETVGFGDILYMASTGKWMKASSAVADSAEFPVAAMAVATISADAAGKLLLYGAVRDDTWNFTTLGNVYVGVDVPTHTEPSTTGHTSQIIGTSLDADRMLFKPSPIYIEVP